MRISKSASPYSAVSVWESIRLSSSFEGGRDLDFWFHTKDIHPLIIGEFEDYALLRAFAQSGTAIFPVPSAFVRELRKQDKVIRIGSTQEVKLRFFAISAERKIKHPAVVAICESARRTLLS